MRATLVLAVLALFVAHAHCAMLYASPEGSPAANCTMETPCSLQQACTQAQSMDTVQLLDGNYQLQNSPCVISSANVKVVGSANVATVCNNSCFVVNAIPFSLSALYISSAGSTPPQAAIFAARAAVDPDAGPLIQVQVSDVMVHTTYNDIFNLAVQPVINDTSVVEITLANVSVTGDAPLSSVVGPVTARTNGRRLSWSISDVTFDQYTSYTGVPLLDVDAFEAPLSVVVDGLTVTNSTIYAVFDANNGASFSLQDALVDTVENYVSEDRSTALFDVDAWSDVTIDGVTLQNVANDVGGLFFLGGTNTIVTSVNISNCVGNGDQLPAIWTTCRSDPCTQTFTDMTVTDTTYDLFGYFLYDYYSNTTLTIQFSSFNNVATPNGQLFNIARCGVLLSDLTFTGGEYTWGVMSVSSPKSFDGLGLQYNDVTSPYALHSFSSEVVKDANINFAEVEVQNSVIDQTVFLFIPDNSTWAISISESDFSTNGSNTTAIVTCYSSDDNDTGGADVLVDSSTCNVGDQCAVQDEGYVGNDICSFEVDDNAVCDACSSSSASDSGDGDGDGDDDSTDWGEIILWICVGLAALVVIIAIIVVLALIVIGVVVMLRKRKQGYEAI